MIERQENQGVLFYFHDGQSPKSIELILFISKLCFYISVLITGSVPRWCQAGGGSPKQISPSAEEGGSRAVIDPFNWCGFNYDNRLPELLLFLFPSHPLHPPSPPHPSSFTSRRPRCAGAVQMFGGLPSTRCNLLATNQQPPLHRCGDTCRNLELDSRVDVTADHWEPKRWLLFPKWQTASLRYE